MGQSSVKPLTESKSGPKYEFGPFLLNVAQRKLLKDGNPVPLTPKAFDVLVLLIESGGRVVQKDELINRVWEDSFVEEGNLKVTVSMLRKALEEEAGERRYIETVPRRGYRFVCSLNELKPEEAELVFREVTKSSITIDEETKELKPSTLGINLTSLPNSRAGLVLTLCWHP